MDLNSPTKTIYDLEIHETLYVNGYLEVIRVPGGWLYCNLNKSSDAIPSTFVPFSNEFQDDETKLVKGAG